MNWLEQIIENKREEVARWKQAEPVEWLRRKAAAMASRPDFRASLKSRKIGLIAEVKRRSPSAGLIRDPFDPGEIARAYERGGAQALSVLMDAKYFGGGPEDFGIVRKAVTLPLLYKEFVIDEWQVDHAASIGASAVLLIVAALERNALVSLAAAIKKAGMQALVEVHDEDEARIAVDCGADIIGINNRNLKTFVTTLETTIKVRPLIPSDRMVISESGIRTGEDVQMLLRHGVEAVLVGEHLLRKPELENAVRALMEPAWASL